MKETPELCHAKTRVRGENVFARVGRDIGTYGMLAGYLHG